MDPQWPNSAYKAVMTLKTCFFLWFYNTIHSLTPFGRVLEQNTKYRKNRVFEKLVIEVYEKLPPGDKFWKFPFFARKCPKLTKFRQNKALKKGGGVLWGFSGLFEGFFGVLMFFGVLRGFWRLEGFLGVFRGFFMKLAYDGQKIFQISPKKHRIPTV